MIIKHIYKLTDLLYYLLKVGVEKMVILILLLSIFVASMNNVLYHKIKLSNNGSILKFNLICSSVWFLILFVANGCKLNITRNSMIFGVLYGVAQVLFILFKTAAMNNGPVSITTLIGNSSLIISVVACLILWNEPITLTDILGLIILVIGIALCTYRKSEQKYNKNWKFYTLFFLIFAAGVGIIFKAFSKTNNDNSVGDMLIVSSIVMFLTYSLICFFTGNFDFKYEVSNKKEVISFTGYALISGLLSCLYNRLNIYLVGVLDGAIYFPSFNGGVILLATILSVLFLKEKIILKQLLGILIGIVGICVIGIF